MNLMFVECRLVSPKSMRFFMKLPSIECVLILLKFRGSFVKLTFTKFEDLLQNCYLNCGLI